MLKAKLTRDDNQPDVESSVIVTGNNVDFAALAAFGKAEELLNNDKYEEANKAFDAVVKKAPDYRPAKVRAAYAAARKGSQ